MLTKPRLLTPGPTPTPERIRLAMAQDMIHHRKPAFKAIMDEAQKGLQHIFGTAMPVLPLSCSGSGAMEAAVSNLFAPGEKVLVIEAGRFAERWTELCRRYRLDPVVATVPWGKAVDPVTIEGILASDPAIRGVFVQLSETSTGVLHPVKALAAITKQRDTLLVVDGISGVSISPCPMDAWGIDCLVTGSQKGLMLPPGLALIALSSRAWDKAEQIPPKTMYFNLIEEQANCLKNQTQFTSPVSLIVGLREALAMFHEVGLTAVYQKQWALTCMARAGIQALGLDLFAKDSYTWGLTSVALPEGISAGKVLEVVLDRFGIVMAAGQGPLKDSMVRMGHMGWVDYGDILAGLHALREGVAACGATPPASGYLDAALQAYHTGLQEPLLLE